MNKAPDGSNVIAQFLGERELFTNQPPNSLMQGVVEMLNVARQACFLTHCLMPLTAVASWHFGKCDHRHRFPQSRGYRHRLPIKSTACCS